MRNELAAEGFGKNGLGEFLNVRRRLGVARLDLVGQREQARHSAHDFLLLGEWWQTDYNVSNVVQVQSGFSLAVCGSLQLLSSVRGTDDGMKQKLCEARIFQSNQRHVLADVSIRNRLLGQC